MKLLAGTLSGLSGVALVAAVAGVGGVGAAGASQSPQIAQAKGALLVRSDFPSGWSTQGSVTTTNGGSANFPGASDLASCLGVSQSLIKANAPSATSPTFQNKGGDQTVSDDVSIFSSTHFANQERAAFSSTKLPGCMTSVLAGPARQEIVSSIGSSGATIGNITVTAMPRANLGGHASGFTMSFPVMAGGQTLQASVSVVSMVRGKAGSQLTFESFGAPIPKSLQQHLVSVAYGRT